jgi:hypothetical protein
LPARRAGLCCAARASRPASAVGVSSNVMPHKTLFLRAAIRSELLCPRTEEALHQLRTPKLNYSANGSESPALNFDAIEPLQATAKDASPRAATPAASRSRSAGQATGTKVISARRASRSEPLGCGGPRSGGVPPLLCRQPRRGCFRSGPAEITKLSRACSVRHNPSLSPRPTTAGRLARAAPWFILLRTGKPSCRSGRG